MPPRESVRKMRSEHRLRYFEDSGFYNFGYWEGGARSQREASEALVDELVGRISNRAGSRDSRRANADAGECRLDSPF